jgi:hypothetical protein
MRDLPSNGQQYYRQAVLETSSLDFDEQLAAAEEAVFLRMEELSAGGDGRLGHQAIEDAIRLLSALKGEILKSTIAIETNQIPDVDTSNSR